MATSKTRTKTARKSGKRSTGRRKTFKPRNAMTFELPQMRTLELAGALDRVAKLVARTVGEIARKHGATPGQLHVVERLARAPSGLTAKQLAAALAIRPGSLTGTLDVLEKKGVIARQAVTGDARQQRLVLLDGAADLVALLPEVDKLVQSRLGTLNDPQIGQLGTLVMRAEAAVRESSAMPMPATLHATPSSNPTPVAAVVEAPAPQSTVPQSPVPQSIAAAAAASDASQTTNGTWQSVPRQQPAKDDARKDPSEGSLGRGLFRIASRVISAADNRRRRG